MIFLLLRSKGWVSRPPFLFTPMDGMLTGVDDALFIPGLITEESDLGETCLGVAGLESFALLDE